jgi:hypothetical protein
MGIYSSCVSGIFLRRVKYYEIRKFRAIKEGKCDHCGWRDNVMNSSDSETPPPASYALHFPKTG